jgi:hypothetical protein
VKLTRKDLITGLSGADKTTFVRALASLIGAIGIASMKISKGRSRLGLQTMRVLSLAFVVFAGATLIIHRTSAAQEIRGGAEKSPMGSERGRADGRLIARLPLDTGGASPGEIRTHLINENILGRLLTMKLRSFDRRCSYGFSVDSDFSITLEAFNTKANADDSLSDECGQQLSSLSRAIEPSEIEFESARKAVADAKTQEVSRRQSTYLVLGVRSAELDVYRQLYADGTPAKIWLSLDASDFENARYDEFLNWYKRHFDGATADAFGAAPDAPDLAAQHVCKVRPIPMVQQLDIAKSGWGQRAILLVDQGYSTAGSTGIANSTLRNLCPPHAQTVSAIDAVSDRLRGILGCVREHLGNDKWLVVYSNKQPVASLDEMKELAQTIAKALGGETCSETRSRIYIANFTAVP